MALLAPSLDYTSPDFDSLEQRIGNLITAVFPDWTDRNKSDFGNILCDLFAFVGDVTGKYQHAQARETRWTQATRLKNILSLVAMIGYEPSGQTAATVDETFTLSASAVADVVLPAGTTVSTQQVTSPVTYQLLEDLTIPSGTLSATASVENSESETDTFASSALPNQTFALTSTPYVDASVGISTGQGAWTVVANFLNSGPNDLDFTVSVDSTQRATVGFGNGVNGAIPQGTISASYKTGGGSAGRVQPGALVVLGGSFTDQNGNPVTITVTNASASSGGLDPETVPQIQQNAPLSVRVSDRTVAREDYEIAALQTPGVARALMTFSDQDPSVPENVGILYLVPTGTSGAVASDALIAAVTAQFGDPPDGKPYPQNTRLRVQSASYAAANIFAKIYRAKNVTGPTAKAAVLAALAAFFAPVQGAFLADGVTANPAAGTTNPLIDFGYNIQDASGNPTGTIAWSTLFDVVSTLPQIRKVGAGALDFTINGARSDLAIALNQFPVLGTVALLDGDTGSSL